MKAFLHGRTEAIRTVQPESVDFTKTFFSEFLPHDKIRKLHKACKRHAQLTKECSQGLGQDWSPLMTVPLYSFLRLSPYQLNLQCISLPRCLQGYKPDERNSRSYLHFLSSPMDKLSPYHRISSNATFASPHEGHSSLDETEPGHASGDYGMVHLHPARSDPTSTMPSPTHTLTPPPSTQGHNTLNQTFLLKMSSRQLLHPVQIPTKILLTAANLFTLTATPVELASLLDPKNLDALQAFGGIDTLLDGLGTDPLGGLTLAGTAGAGVGASQRHDRQPLSVATPHDCLEVQVSDNPHTALIDDRKRVFGDNFSCVYTKLVELDLQSLVVYCSVRLTCAWLVPRFWDTSASLLASPLDWVEGVAVMIAVLIVVVVGSINDWQKERQFKVLNEKKEERGVKVICDGVERLIDVKDVVVGDVALLEPGEIDHCDGTFLAAGGGVSTHTGCFAVSGSKVLEGIRSYVVIAVGTKSFNGRIMMGVYLTPLANAPLTLTPLALRTDAQNTPLQLKLNVLADLIAKIGSIAGIILFSTLMIRFMVQLVTGSPAR
ncbi:hypothetical protein P692DRAFT_20883216 [Suillus brevipes Sb2]|nr:hypothetical protein P692DRAFT_20883216 [Suillus brevipes Sb2]